MKHTRLIAALFVIAAVAWIVVAVRQPEQRIPFGMLALLNLGLAVVYFRRSRSRPRE